MIVWLLAVPRADGYTCSHQLDGVFPGPDTVAGYEPVMAVIYESIRREAVPFLDRYGDVDRFLAHQRERKSGWPSVLSARTAPAKPSPATRPRPRPRWPCRTTCSSPGQHCQSGRAVERRHLPRLRRAAPDASRDR
ncbi:hypothetical protein KRMM14A1259_02110 [Krasilnikovia sp. MM14-A1259]